MRPYTGIAPFSLPNPEAKDFTPRLQNMLSVLDYWARDAAFGFQRITQGDAPTGAGTSIGVTSHHALSDLTNFDDHPQYLYLAGRSGGQLINSVDAASVTLTLSPLSGQTANALEVRDTTGTSKVCTTKDGYLLVGSTTRSITSPTGDPQLYVRGASSAGVDGIRVLATASAGTCLQLVNGNTQSVALRVENGATATTAGILHSGAVASGVLPAGSTTTSMLVQGIASAGPHLLVKHGSHGGTPNLQEWKDTGGTTQCYVDSAGVLHGPVSGITGIDNTMIANRTRAIFLTPTQLYNGFTAHGLTLGTNPDATVRVGYAGTADTTLYSNLIVPYDYVSMVGWYLHCTTRGTQTNTVRWKLDTKRLPAGTDLTAASDDSTQTSWTPSGTASVVNVVQIGTNSTGYAAGNCVRLTLTRNAASDAADTNTDSAEVLLVEFRYTADM